MASPLLYEILLKKRLNILGHMLRANADGPGDASLGHLRGGLILIDEAAVVEEMKLDAFLDD